MKNQEHDLRLLYLVLGVSIILILNIAVKSNNRYTTDENANLVGAGAQVIAKGTPYSAFQLGYSNFYKFLAQSFTSTESGYISDVSLAMIQTGTPTFDIVVSIRGNLQGPDLAAKVIRPTSLSTDYRYPTSVTVTFENRTNVVAEQTYYLVLTATALDSNNYYWWDIKKNNPYAKGEFYIGSNVQSKYDALAIVNIASNSCACTPGQTQCSGTKYQTCASSCQWQNSGTDADQDGVDLQCGDSLCDNSPGIRDSTKTATETACSDELDNDCDGKADSADSDCAQPLCGAGQNCGKLSCFDTDLKDYYYTVKGSILIGSTLVYNDKCSSITNLDEGFCENNFDGHGNNRWIIKNVDCTQFQNYVCLEGICDSIVAFCGNGKCDNDIGETYLYCSADCQPTGFFITSLIPNIGPVGTAVTISGAGFSTSFAKLNNVKLKFLDNSFSTIIAHLKSNDGIMLTFNIPDVSPGKYNVSVFITPTLVLPNTPNIIDSNPLNFTVTSS